MKVFSAVGTRKMAIARAVIRRGKGRVRVNHRPVELYSPELARLKLLEPLILAGDRAGKVDIEVNVQGGGVMGQACAARTAIAKAIIGYLEDSELDSVYRAYDRTLVVSDPRRKEPKHQCGRGARKKRQKSYR